TDSEMTPRQQITAVGYAVRSETSEKAETADKVDGSQNIFPGSGNVGIGTKSPASKLTVAGTIQSTSEGFKFPDGTTQTSAGSVIAIKQGTASHDSLITPPSGYTVSQCTCIVSPRSFGPDGSSQEAYRHWCYVTQESNGWRVYARSQNAHYGHMDNDTANYYVIGIK
ncbi:MAG: hypothetical protein JW928_04665, partial [Candidatus Aureabacteria bacterium]|nr:hypothetical protein [Candidatus Auribacterota bacterium]